MPVDSARRPSFNDVVGLIAGRSAQGQAVAERVVWRVALLSAVLYGGALLWAASPVPDQWPPVLAVIFTAGVTLVVSAALMSAEPAGRRTATLLGIAALWYLLSWVRRPMPGAIPFLSTLAAPMFWWLVGWAMLRFPNQQLWSGRQRAWVVVALAWLIPGHIVVSLLYNPAWFPDRWVVVPWWPTSPSDRFLYDAVHGAILAVDGVLALWFVWLVLQQLRTLADTDRWIRTPMAWSLVCGGVLVGGRITAPILGSHNWSGQFESLLSSLAVLSIPTAFLSVEVRKRLIRAAVADMVLGLGGVTNDAYEGVTTALRRALRDPELSIQFWIPQEERFVDEQGQQVSSVPTDRLAITIDDIDGRPAGVVLIDPALHHHQELVAAAMAATRLALTNARLQATVLSQLEEVKASRRRIAESALAERSRIEHDLHDGVQQRLLALTLTLAQIRATSNDPALHRAAETVRAEVHAALAELRDLAHGVMPTLLLQGGLRTAVDDMVDRLPIPVELFVTDIRFAPVVEATAYFLICEALTNVVKHAAASTVRVTVRVDGGALHLDVVDDGRGGADIRAGHGLAGLRDRTGAVGGQFIVLSGPPGGTRVSAVLPCG